MPVSLGRGMDKIWKFQSQQGTSRSSPKSTGQVHEQARPGLCSGLMTHRFSLMIADLRYLISMCRFLGQRVGVSEVSTIIQAYYYKNELMKQSKAKQRSSNIKDSILSSKGNSYSDPTKPRISWPSGWDWGAVNDRSQVRIPPPLFCTLYCLHGSYGSKKKKNQIQREVTSNSRIENKLCRQIFIGFHIHLLYKTHIKF